MRKFPVRFQLVLATFSLTLLLYIDRVAISAAKSEIGTDLSLDDAQLGWVMSAFALGYALFQVPSGILNDRLGPRRIITLIVSIWSLFTFLTGMVKNFVSLIIIRFLFGGGEAGAFPGISRATFSWIPLQERGIVTGINFSGSRLGAAFAFPMVTWLILTFGWRSSFYILGAVGVIWAVLWYFWFRDLPEEHPSVSQNEKDFILAHRQEKAESPGKLSVGRILGSKNMLLMMGQYFGSNFIFFFCLTWMFPYLRERFEVDAYQASVYAMFPLICGAFGNWFSGWLVDYIYKKGQWKWSRAIPAIIGFSLVGIGIIGILSVEEVLLAVIFLSLAVFGADMTLSPSWSFCVDVGKSHAGTVAGTMNMAGNIGSFITGIAFPYLIIWTGTSDTFFIISGILVILSIIAWLNVDPSNPIEHEKA
ncbi:MAG: MFS transporter [Bacteroidota bacterium]